MQSVETANDIISAVEELKGHLAGWTEKGVKASAKKARKSTLDLEKKFKVFRKQSVIDATK